MKSNLLKAGLLRAGLLLAFVPSLLLLDGCAKAVADQEGGAPPAAKVVPVPDASIFTVEHPEQFPLATAKAQPTAAELVVTGTVNPDIDRKSVV